MVYYCTPCALAMKMYMAKAVSRGNDGVEILFQIKNLTKKNNLVLNKATGHP